MNAQSLIAKKNEVRTHRTTMSLAAVRIAIGRLIENLDRKIKVGIRRDASRKSAGYRLGGVVHHGSFGRGQIVAVWPDGRLLVNFSADGENQLVFPSFLAFERD
jgi:hypothetical protein